MSEERRAFFALAEALHMTVEEVENMRTSEYIGWIEYFEEKDRQRRASEGDVTAMTSDEMIKNLTL